MSFDRPWERVPPEIGVLIRPHLATLSEELIATIRERVPAYHRPLRGRFGANLREGVQQALGQFADLVAEPDVDRSDLDAVYRQLGRGEYREQRSLDALLSAYRLGARVSWRRISQIAIDSGAEGPTLALLAEAVFAYIDELSALSADGYAQAQSAAAGESERLRRRLAALLLDPDSSEDTIDAAAAGAGWEVPARVAALVWSGDAPRLISRLPAGSLNADGGPEGGLAFVGDPGAPGLAQVLERAIGEGTAVLGPATPPNAAHLSASRARSVLRLIGAGTIADNGLVHADARLGALITHHDEVALRDLTARVLAPLEAETPASRERLTQTLRAWLDHHGEVARMATELHVHPQTVRYRLARLRERLGPAMDDPDARFELSLALRHVVSRP